MPEDYYKGASDIFRALNEYDIAHTFEQLWQTTPRSITLLGEGVYGRCYGVTLSRAPSRVVAKVYKFAGIAHQEHCQLLKLRVHFPDLVPQVYAHFPETEPGAVLIMEWLPGQSCPRPERLPFTLRKSLQEQTVNLLLQLHTVTHREGYGTFDGPFYPRWWDYYGQRIKDTHQAINRSEEACAYLGPQVLTLMDRALDYGERILDTAESQPVLLHGDFCFGNLLFDPQTWRISGLLDPLDAEWGARELDLVNVINRHIHHFELLNQYREAIDLGPYFPLRYWFYHIWKWLFYYVRVQAPCREWVLRCGHELEKAIEKHF